MTAFTHSLVMICPVEHLATANAAGEAVGHSSGEFTVPLSADGSEPATHYGLHAWATPETAYAWTIAEEIPGITAEQITQLRAILVISAQTELTGAAHFASVLEANGLVRVVPPDPEA